MDAAPRVAVACRALAAATMLEWEAACRQAVPQQAAIPLALLSAIQAAPTPADLQWAPVPQALADLQRVATVVRETPLPV